MLHAVDDNRPAARTDVQQSFHAQDVATVAMQQHGQPDAKGGPFQRPLETQAESMNAGAVPIGVQLTVVGLGSPSPLNGEPAANFFDFAFKVIDITGKDLVWIDSNTWGGFQLASRRVDFPQSPGQLAYSHLLRNVSLGNHDAVCQGGLLH